MVASDLELKNLDFVNFVETYSTVELASWDKVFRPKDLVLAHVLLKSPKELLLVIIPWQILSNFRVYKVSEGSLMFECCELKQHSELQWDWKILKFEYKNLDLKDFDVH